MVLGVDLGYELLFVIFLKFGLVWVGLGLRVGCGVAFLNFFGNFELVFGVGVH